VKNFLLGELIKVTQGFPFDSNVFGDSGDLPLIRIRDVVPGRSNTYLRGACPPQHLIRNGDILIGMDGEFNRARWQGGLAALNQRVCRIQPKDERLDDGYLFHWLPMALKKIEAATPFVTVKHLSVKQLHAAEIPLPPLSEQRRIAAILNQADALRAKRRQTLTQLDEMAQVIFVEMFCGQAATTWPNRSIECLSQAIRTGPFGSQLLHSEFVDEGIAVLGIDNAVQNRFAWDERRFITPEKYNALRRFKVFAGDVIITIMGTCGRVAVVPDDIPEAITTKHLCCITLKSHECLPEFLHATLMWHPEVLRQFGVRERGAVMPGLNMGLIKECRLRLAPLALQSRFVDRWKAIQDMASLGVCSATDFDGLFASLQHRAFRGEL
jgi:type I restriction enzyme S subunit